MYGGFNLRLWINNPDNQVPIADILKQVREAVHDIVTAVDHITICEYLARSVPNLNAVQVIEQRHKVKVGHMIYTVPFAE